MINAYNPERRYKDRAAARTAAFLKFLALTTVCLLIGFWLGKQYGSSQVIALQSAIDQGEQDREELQEALTQAEANARTAAARYEQLQEQVQSVLPKGPLQDLVALLRKQLENGTDPERLSFVIRSTRPPTGCVDPESKRFVVATPANKNASSAVMVEDIKITAMGESARNQNNDPEAWYDPAKPVAMAFTANGKTDVKKGTLPLKYSVVSQNREYRFTAEEGARSFLKVTYDSCDYP